MTDGEKLIVTDAEYEPNIDQILFANRSGDFLERFFEEYDRGRIEEYGTDTDLLGAAVRLGLVVQQHAPRDRPAERYVATPALKSAINYAEVDDGSAFFAVDPEATCNGYLQSSYASAHQSDLAEFPHPRELWKMKQLPEEHQHSTLRVMKKKGLVKNRRSEAVGSPPRKVWRTSYAVYNALESYAGDYKPPEYRPYWCPCCLRRYARVEDAERHYEAVHDDEYPFT